MIMKLKPLADNVLVKMLKQEEKTESGIIVSLNKKFNDTKGIAVELGSGKFCTNGKHAEFDVAVGDIVMFSQYSGDEYIMDGIKYKIMKEQEILCVLNKE